MHVALALPLLFGVACCSTASLPPTVGGGPVAQKLAPMIFVHGLKGSTLVDADKSVRWLTRLQALGLASPALALPLSWDGSGRQATDGVTPASVLEQVYVVPYLLGDDAYTPWLNAMKSSGRPFYPFAYDWRRDNLESLAKLKDFVAQVRAQNGGERVRLVSHSMGGLLALALLNQEPDSFESVTFAGVPFGGGMGFLKDLTVGTQTGLNRRILTPRILGTFPSVYCFFPLDGHGLADAQNHPMPVDYYAVGTWSKNRWGLFGGSEAIDPAATTFLATALAHAKQFRQMLAPRDVAYPPLRVVLAKHVSTLNGARLGADTSLPDFNAMPTVAGDGRIAEDDATPPKPLTYEVRQSRNEHSELLNDPAIIAWLTGPLAP